MNAVNNNGILRSADDYLAKAQTPPNNDTADGNGGSFAVGSLLASLEVYVSVNEEVTIPDTQTLTVKLQESADDQSYSDLAVLYANTASGGNAVLTADSELARYVIPTNVKKHVKAQLVTTGAVTGKVDVFFRYVPR